jgi:hypothetical protein
MAQNALLRATEASVEAPGLTKSLAYDATVDVFSRLDLAELGRCTRS